MQATSGSFDRTGDIMIIPVFGKMEKAPNNTTVGLSRGASIAVKAAAASDAISGKPGESLSVWTEACTVIFIGVGDKEKLTHKGARDAGAKCLAKLSKDIGTEIVVRFTTGWKTANMAAFAEGMILRDYAFDKYQKNDEDEQDKGEWSLECQAHDRHLEALDAAVAKSESIATGVHLARDLANEPANRLYPDEYGRRALEWAEGKENVEVEVWDYARLQKEGMQGVIAVGKGSIRKPCMVFFRLNPDAQEGEQVPCIVGKGITFDTGGISIKPSQGMWDMKYDMHGSATVFGLFQALWATGHKGRVNGITCMAENMPSAEAYRPGDVIDTYSGKTIEIFSTDAEGRNVLSDGLWKAAELNPSYIVDLATLTGACVVALGHEASGLWSNDDKLRDRIHEAGNDVDELAWPMPLLPAFEKEMTSSKFADVRNGGKGRWGGANTAAAFLKQFVQEREGEDGEKSQIPWAHLDIAGTAWGADTNACVAHGGTGVHVRTLHHLITQD